MKNSEFTFLGYRVSHFTFDIQDSFVLGNSKFLQTINIKQNFSKDDKRFVEIIMEFTVKTEDNSLVMNIILRGGFRGCSEMSDESFQSMYSVNAPAILYPFIRAYIATCTSQSGIPAVILPLINLAGNNE